MSYIFVSKNDDTRKRIRELIVNLCTLDTSTGNSINLESVLWVTPLSILPLAVKISNTENLKKASIELPTDNDIKQYLEVISFPKGIDDVYYTGSVSSTYLPIVKISNIKSKVLDNVVEQYQKMLFGILKDQNHKSNILNALPYFIGEMATNVQEHSDAKEFWISGQYWPKNEEIEICMVDNGIGFVSSYKNADIEVSDDMDAIEKAIQGISSKTEFGRRERGFGISTSHRLITESPLRGEMVIISGSAGHLGKYNNPPIKFRLPDSYAWDGVIVASRMQKPLEQVDINKYIE